MDEDMKTAVNLVLHFKWVFSFCPYYTSFIVLSRLPKTYPKLAPHILLESIRGISGTHLTSLNELLRRTAKSLLGSEMIYELATSASAFLTENNSVVRFGKLSSLNEDRNKREEVAEQVAATQAVFIERVEQDKREAEDRKLEAEIDSNRQKHAQLREERTLAEQDLTNVEMPDVTSIERFDKALRLPGKLQANIVIKGSSAGHSK